MQINEIHSRQARKRRRERFTLIELLVVISIIAVLASILLPALKKSKDRAMSIVCTGNLKQMGLVTVNYSMDNNGWIYPADGREWIPGDWDGTSTTLPFGVGLFFKFLLYNKYIPCNVSTTPQPNTLALPSGYYIWPYIDIAYCPSFLQGTGVYSAGYTTYGQRGGVVVNLATAPVTERLKLYDGSHFYASAASRSSLSPSEYLIWGDSIYRHPIYGGNGTAQQYIIERGTTTYQSALVSPIDNYNKRQFHLRHFNGGNAWFADGHASNVKLNDVIENNLGIDACAVTSF